MEHDGLAHGADAGAGGDAIDHAARDERGAAAGGDDGVMASRQERAGAFPTVLGGDVGGRIAAPGDLAGLGLAGLLDDAA